MQNTLADNLIKSRIAEELLDAPIKADRWKNLFFDKTGKSYLAPLVWPSAKDAKECSDTSDRHAKALLKTGINCQVKHTKGFILFSEYSHTIQIPWNRE
jgi:hypothetical protein